MIDIKTGSIIWIVSFDQGARKGLAISTVEIGKRLAKELVNKVYKAKSSH